MSFRKTKTPNKPTTPAKWQKPTRPKYRAVKDEYYLEGELKERFCKLFPKNSNRRMMTWFGISFSTLQRFKREFGLEKDMKSIIRQQAKDTKKICERNGYYASIRGKGPSEACLEATRQLRAEGFHPIKQLKANNPRKYKRLMQKKSEQRTENTLVHDTVTEEEIATIVAKWTGIPVAKLMEGEREKLLHLSEIIHKRVVGQDEAVEKVTRLFCAPEPAFPTRTDL